MGTREVYEEKLRSGNLYHVPTMQPGLGSPRCPRCLSLLSPDAENGEWAITPVIRDATAVMKVTIEGERVPPFFTRCYKWYTRYNLAFVSAGSGIGGVLSAVHGFNTGIPFAQKYVKGPKWLPFLIGVPAFLMYSAGSAAFGGYALPKLAQVTITSYYAASSVSHYGVSLLTRKIEEYHTSPVQQERDFD